MSAIYLYIFGSLLESHKLIWRFNDYKLCLQLFIL